VLALGGEQAGDRFVGGAGEGVLEVELVIEGAPVLLLPLPLSLRRHVHREETPGAARVVGFMRRGKSPLLRRSASTSSCALLGNGL
jgi:hypothetical protein